MHDCGGPRDFQPSWLISDGLLSSGRLMFPISALHPLQNIGISNEEGSQKQKETRTGGRMGAESEGLLSLPSSLCTTRTLLFVAAFDKCFDAGKRRTWDRGGHSSRAGFTVLNWRNVVKCQTGHENTIHRLVEQLPLLSKVIRHKRREVSSRRRAQWHFQT